MRATSTRTSLLASVGFILLQGAAAVGYGPAQGPLSNVSEARPQVTQQSERRSHRGPSIPMGLSIQALTAVGSDTVFAGSFGMGVFRSEDRGESWAPASQGLTDPFILSLEASRDGSLYAGTVRGGVFRSRDGGKTWEGINRGLKRLQIKALLASKGTVYAGTGDGVYRRDVGTDRWASVTTGLEDVLVHCLALADDGTLYAGTSGKGVMQYRRNSSAWTSITQGLKDHEGLRENFIRVLALDAAQSIYVGTFDGGVFRSVDRGETWRPFSRALPNDSIRGIVVKKESVVVGTGRGVFKTLHHGREWMPINEGLTELSVQALIGSPHGSLYAGTNAGAFRIDGNARSWESINRGMEGVRTSPFRRFK